MMEFIASRSVMCVCGVVLLASVLGFMSTMEEDENASQSELLAGSFASMLDRFESSDADALILRGNEMVPDEDVMITVADHLVRIEHDGRTFSAYTTFGGTFVLTKGTIAEISKGSVPEGLGDLPDRIDEYVDLASIVVDIG